VFSKNGNTRVSFSKLETVLDLPHLAAIQTDPFEDFLQAKVDPDKRENRGLQAVFLQVFPITDVQEIYSLEFVRYIIEQPRYTIEECQERNMTYGAPLKATLRLVTRESEGNTSKVKDIIEQDVFLGELPLMTERGTFIINGAERVIVSQLHRSPGVFFDEEVHPNGKKLYSARIIPYRVRGSNLLSMSTILCSFISIPAQIDRYDFAQNDWIFQRCRLIEGIS
jgi:DNA-directed RNA polymerase subunit beta